jgi:hypothetical protein
MSPRKSVLSESLAAIYGCAKLAEMTAKGEGMKRILLGACAGLALAGCSFGQDKQAAEAAVVQFHQMLDAGRYHDIYNATSDDFRRVTSEAEFTRILQTIHERFGAVRQTNEGSWRVNFANGGDMVVLHYATQFASAHGDEEFIYRSSGGAARLAGYHINSPALLGPAEPTQNTAKPGEDATAPAQSVVRLPGAPSPPKPAGGK